MNNRFAIVGAVVSAPESERIEMRKFMARSLVGLRMKKKNMRGHS